MPKTVNTKISGLNIRIEYNNERIPHLCHDYIVEDKNPEIKVSYDESKCASEAKTSGYGMLGAEFACIYRQIAEKLPEFSRVVCHGAVISYKDNGYMFIAKSGTGKTTHINLWRKYIEGVEVINGDKPIIEVNGKRVIAYGTPWAGKEMLQTNTCAELKGICVIKQANHNSIKRIGASDAINAMMSQIYMPENIASLNLTIKLMDNIITHVPFYELSCDISREAALCSFTAMTGESLEQF